MGTFWLHYVGKRLYSIDHFEKEARRYGVQRAVPFYQIRKFRWGDRILLAHWLDGNAEVFGYFTVEAITHNLPDEVTEELIDKLDVISISKGTPKYERRFCGGYYIGGSVLIKNSVEDLHGKIKEICERSGIDPNSVKWFLRGKYTKLVNSVVLSPAKFTRSYMKVEIEGLDLDSADLSSGVLVWVYNYTQRKYFRKGEEKLLETTIPLDDYMEA
ncbi:MAG: hypothetical protein JRD89_20050 [Deltaproteobacteria bacterium]|nr:hypothetical protein [Deltaproteobacteria bacterium]